MSVNSLISKLVAIGYQPCEVEYSLSEILQHKNPNLLNTSDINILISMLEEKIQLKRAARGKTP